MPRATPVNHNRVRPFLCLRPTSAGVEATTEGFSNYLVEGVGDGADYNVSETGTSKIFGSGRDFPR